MDQTTGSRDELTQRKRHRPQITEAVEILWQYTQKGTTRRPPCANSCSEHPYLIPAANCR
jgi:hypothetical protein